MNPVHIHTQASAYTSPWSVRVRVRVLLWDVCWLLACRWTPKPMNAWRLVWLRAFGAHVDRGVFVHGRARIIRPWNLTLRQRACVGDGATLYGLDRIDIGPGATVAQEAYICTGTHAFDDPATPLKTAAIVVGAGAFVGLRAIVLPGVCVGTGCVVGAGAVLSRDASDWTVYAGAPARPVGMRKQMPLSFPDA